MLLENKTAVIYGGAGRVGGPVARVFAREGARVFLAGRTQEALDAVAEDITAAGGQAETAVVDATDEESVDRHADGVAEKADGIDVSLNLIGLEAVHGLPLLSMPYEDFFRSISIAMRSLFITARAAARHMIKQGSGVIVAKTATTARLAIPEVGGTGVTFDAIESQCRQWACELGPHGVRVVWVLTTGLPETLPDIEFPGYDRAEGRKLQEHIEWMTKNTMLNRLTTLEEVGTAAAFLASDRAGSITGAGINLTCGSVPTR